MAATPDPDVLTDADRRWLDQISTQWTAVQDAEQFVLRYGPAIRRYCESLLPRCDEADDVVQELLVRVVEKGFPHVDARKGRFRDYLKVTVRNAVITHLRRGARLPVAIADHDRAGMPDEPAADAVWMDQWRTCILDRAWRLLDAHEKTHRDSRAYSVLRAVVDHPDATSDDLAGRLRTADGNPMNAALFRKHVSRARRLFARLVLQEVASTLDFPRPEAVEEELIDCGLWEAVRDFLPDDWKVSLPASPPE
jgi:RNA polymerase sigma factor (sigma-70 family)